MSFGALGANAKEDWEEELLQWEPQLLQVMVVWLKKKEDLQNI